MYHIFFFLSIGIISISQYSMLVGAVINAVDDDDGSSGGGGADVIVIVIAFRTWKCIINIVCDLVSSSWLALSIFSE